MTIIELAPQANGAHRNQTIAGADPAAFPIPEGWALFPDGLDREHFPFGEAEAEESGGVLTVTRWTPGTLPPPEETETREETA